MGKSKRNKNKRVGPSPTGLATVKDTEKLANEENTSNLSNAVLNLVEKLQGPSADERECTCATIATLLSQPGATDQFLRAGFVRVAGPLLVDPSLGVRRTALGALRNLTVDGGLNTCTAMIDQDVMTPLVTLLQKFGTEWGTDKHQDKEAEVYHEALHLLWNLCESSPTAVKIFNQQNLLPLLLPSLLPSSHGYPVAITTAQCLYTVSEDNSDFCQLLNKPESVQEIQKILMSNDNETSSDSLRRKSEVMLHKVLLTGILYNVSGGELSRLGAGLVGHVIDLLVTVLDTDVSLQLTQVSQFLEKLKSQPGACPSTTDMDAMIAEDVSEGLCAGDSPGGSTENTPGGSTSDNNDGQKPTTSGAESKKRNVDEMELKHKELDELISHTQNLINAQQVAIETTANLSCGKDEEEWEDEEESESSSDDLTATDAQTDDITDTMDFQESLCLPEEIQRAFVQSGLVHKVFQKLKPLPEELITTLGSHNQSKILKQSYTSLHLRALLCTSNLVSALPLSDVGGAGVLRELWAALSSLLAVAVTAECGETLEGATAALRAVVDKLDDEDDEQFQQVTSSDLDFLCRLGAQCCHPEVRANTTQILATLGGQLVQSGQYAHLKGIGEYLYHIASQDPELWVVAEALDAMFDVFADDNTDPVVKELGLVGKLRELVPTLKQKVQQQKRKLGEHFAIVSTAKTNLVRFIKYKSNRPSANS